MLSRVLFFAAGPAVLMVLAQAPPPLDIPPNRCTNSGSVGCVIPTLFGPQAGGIVLPNPFHAAHFASSFQSSFTPLNTAIATQLTLLPLASPASGFTYKYDQGTGGFVPSSSTLGPILTERAETIGRRKFFFATTYQRFRFSTLDSQNVHNLPAVFTHIEGTGPATDPDPAYEAEVITTTNNVDLKIDQFTFFTTVGLTDRLDVSLAIPVMDVRMSGGSAATIRRVEQVDPLCAPPGGAPGVCHYFDPNNQAGSTSANFAQRGSATGLGDIILRVKGTVLTRRKVAVALATDIRFPSGKETDFLGSGAIGIRPFAAISLKGPVAPHFNIGYQWNGESVLAGNILTGQKAHLPGQFFYSVGTDVALHKRVTLAADYLGQELFDAPKLSTSAVRFQNTSLPSVAIAPSGNTYGINNGAVGVKINPFGRLLVTANILFRLNNAGLRQAVTPLIGLSYATE